MTVNQLPHRTFSVTVYGEEAPPPVPALGVPERDTPGLAVDALRDGSR